MTDFLKNECRGAARHCVKSIIKSASNIVASYERFMTPDRVCIVMVVDIVLVAVLVAGKVAV